jgi:hypothetical protein
VESGEQVGLSSFPATIVVLSQVPHMTSMTESNDGPPHIEAVIVLPVPVTEYQTPLRASMFTVPPETTLFVSMFAPPTFAGLATVTGDV